MIEDKEYTIRLNSSQIEYVQKLLCRDAQPEYIMSFDTHLWCGVVEAINDKRKAKHKQKQLRQPAIVAGERG